MAAYVVVNVDVTDPVKFAEYGRGVPATIEQYGGRYLVRGGTVHPVEGKVHGTIMRGADARAWSKILSRTKGARRKLGDLVSDRMDECMRPAPGRRGAVAGDARYIRRRPD